MIHVHYYASMQNWELKAKGYESPMMYDGMDNAMLESADI